jgi:hypothetical protein
LFGRDVIHGYRTVFPIPLGMAAAWNPELVELAAAIAASEASADGIKWTFAPMVDIARDPRWGRVAEGSGEDPFLASTMAAAAVRGYQGTDMSAPIKLCCAKHFVVWWCGRRSRLQVGVSSACSRYLLPSFRRVNAVSAPDGRMISMAFPFSAPAAAYRYLTLRVGLQRICCQ